VTIHKSWAEVEHRMIVKTNESTTVNRPGVDTGPVRLRISLTNQPIVFKVLRT